MQLEEPTSLPTAIPNAPQHVDLDRLLEAVEAGFRAGYEAAMREIAERDTPDDARDGEIEHVEDTIEVEDDDPFAFDRS